MGVAERIVPARWGRLLSEEDAAEYLAISRTTMRTLGISARRIGKRVLYDRRELDGFVDRMGDGPAAPRPTDDAAARAAEERRFMERREQRRGAD